MWTFTGFHAILSAENMRTKARRECMEDLELVRLRESAMELIRECGDADLLDLVVKLIVECAGEMTRV